MAYLYDDSSERATQRYIQTSMRQPLLSREDEQDLALRWRDNRDEAALHQLTQAYMRLVVSMAGKFRNYGLPMADLIQAGNIGLMLAAEKFEPEREVRFSTYASWWIRSSIQDFVLRNWSIVRTGTTASQKSLFFNLRRLRAKIQDPSATHMTEGQRQEIADTLAVPTRDVLAMEYRLAASDQSLNAPITLDGDDDWQSTLADERSTPEQVVVGMRNAEARSRWLADALGELSDRERLIIERRRLTDEVITLEELGRELGVSKERVRQLENRAMGKLKKCMERFVDQPDEYFVEG